MPNIFGGENKNSLYTPMTEDEREVLQRLVDSDDLEIIIKEWGIVNKFTQVRFGDMRLQIIFKVVFSSPSVFIPVNHFDLQLKTRSGILLYEETQPINPVIMVGDGVRIDLCWDIAIKQMDPKLVKAIKPGAIGLTTREGNRHLDIGSQEILDHLRAVEDVMKLDRSRVVSQIKDPK